MTAEGWSARGATTNKRIAVSVARRTADKRSTLRGFVDRHGLFAPTEVVPTFPSRRPLRPLDHVFVSRDLALVERAPLEVRVSDHLALLVEVVPGAHASRERRR